VIIHYSTFNLHLREGGLYFKTLHGYRGPLKELAIRYAADYWREENLEVRASISAYTVQYQGPWKSIRGLNEQRITCCKD
jgi:hypothetical protein